MTWRESTLNALDRQMKKRRSDIVTLQQLKTEELDQMIKETGTTAKNPGITLEQCLRVLRDAGRIEFVDYKGTYRVSQNQ